MHIIGLLILVVIIYMAYQVGRIKGKAEMFFQKSGQRKPGKDKIEEAEYEEIK